MAVATKDVPGFPGYSVQDDGVVTGLSGAPLRQLSWGIHYLKVVLYKNKKAHPRLVHRVVLEAFVGECPDGMECRHLNSIPTDNRLSNLRWGTRSENSMDRVRAGRGPARYAPKLTDDKVREIRFIRSSSGLPHTEIAKAFGVSRRLVGRVLDGSLWSQVQ
jgi:hypothetical protein